MLSNVLCPQVSCAKCLALTVANIQLLFYISRYKQYFILLAPKMYALNLKMLEIITLWDESVIISSIFKRLHR